MLGPERYAPLSVLWSAVFLTVPSVWGPLEQELARRLSSRSETGDGGAPVVRAGWATALAVGAPLVALLLLTAPWSAERLFSGEVAVALALGLAVATFAANHVTRAAMAGVGAFRAYGACISLDSASRLAACLVLAAADVRSPVPYAFAVAVAPLVPVLVLRARGTAVTPGPDERARDVATHVLPLVGGQVFAQVLVNGGPIAVALLAAPGEEEVAGQFLAALLIARIPLFFFQAVQGSLLPGLARRRASGDRSGFVGQVRSLLLAVALVGSVGVVGAAVAGPAVVRLAFGDAFALGPRDLAVLTVGIACFMAATVGAQAVVALAGHRSVGLAWALGTAVAAVAVTVAEDLVWRVELGFLLGTAAAGTAHLVALSFGLRRWSTAGSDRSGSGLGGLGPARPRQ